MSGGALPSRAAKQIKIVKMKKKKYKNFTFKGKWLEDIISLGMPAENVCQTVFSIVDFGCTGNEAFLPCNDCEKWLEALNLFEEIAKEIRSKNNTQKCDKPAKPGSNIPPSLEEVKNYILERGIDIDHELWWNYYEARGWFMGKTKMKNWHNSIATWVRNQKNNYAHGNDTKRQQEDEFKAKLNSIFAK